MYTIHQGAVLLLNPGDNHACVQCGTDTLDYRAINLSVEVLSHLSAEIADRQAFPIFPKNVIWDEDIARYFHRLHEMVLTHSNNCKKKEVLFLLISALIRRYGHSAFVSDISTCREEVEKACRYMDTHFAKHITLEQLCHCAGLSKSILLRAFTKEKGVTPYCYLENIRIREAGKLLVQGKPPLEAALQTGFSDQSHFTNYFHRFIGLSPGAYRGIFGYKETAEAQSNET